MKKKRSLSNILLILFISSMLFPTVDFQFATAGSGKSVHDWWDTDWHYRIRVDVDSGDFERDDDPIELELDFASLFSFWGISSVLDPHSIRVVDQSDWPSEVLSQFDPRTGEIVWLTGRMRAGTQKTYFVYFDHLGNGTKDLPNYYNSFDDGGILIVNAEDAVSIKYKIGGIEYETSTINPENGEICFVKPPFGDSLVVGEMSKLGFFPQEEGLGQRIMSIRGGPVRYEITFHHTNESNRKSCPLNDYGYEFYYVSNGHEVRAKFHISSTGNSIPARVNDLDFLLDNSYQIVGLNGMLGLFPVNQELLEETIDEVNTQEIFWIHGLDTQRCQGARSFYNRVHSSPGVAVNFGQDLYALDDNLRVRLNRTFRRENFFSIHRGAGRANRYSNKYPGEFPTSISWLDGDWKYRKSLSISGSSVGPQFDYPIRIVINYSNGEDWGENVFLGNKCRDDFEDIRFTQSDGTTLLSYWIERLTVGENAIFWVKVESIPSSPDAATLYIYYGKNDAMNMSNGKETFDWFDDFDVDSSHEYDIGKHAGQWHDPDICYPYYDPENKRVVFDTENDTTGGWMVRGEKLNIQDFAAKVLFGITGFYPHNTSNGILGRWRGQNSFYGFYICGGHYTHSPALIRDGRTVYIDTPLQNTYHPFEGIPHSMELRIYGNRLTGIYNEGKINEVMLVEEDLKHKGSGKVGIIVGQSSGWFDVFFVRKYVYPEPECDLWEHEEVQIYPPIDLIFERKINRNLFSKEAFHTIRWSFNPKNKDFARINYRIYRKSAAESEEDFQLLDTIQSDTFIYSDGYLDESKKYLYVLTSTDSDGHESVRSSVVGNLY
jgi:hypothetical protein